MNYIYIFFSKIAIYVYFKFKGYDKFDYRSEKCTLRKVCIGYMQCVGNIKTTNMSSMWNINKWGEPCRKIFSGIRQD